MNASGISQWDGLVHNNDAARGGVARVGIHLPATHLSSLDAFAMDRFEWRRPLRGTFCAFVRRSRHVPLSRRSHIRYFLLHVRYSHGRSTPPSPERPFRSTWSPISRRSEAEQQANAINDSGQVVGEFITSGGSLHAFLYSGGVFTDMGTDGGAYSDATAINNSRSDRRLTGSMLSLLWRSFP